MNTALRRDLGWSQRSQLEGDGPEFLGQTLLGGLEVEPQVARWSVIRSVGWSIRSGSVFHGVPEGPLGEEFGPQRAVLVVQVQPDEVVERGPAIRLVPVSGLNRSQPELLANVIVAVGIQTENPSEA